MKTSFIIPVYNEETYIEDCLRSIYNLEDLTDFEILVVDNGSTDRTTAIVAEKFPEAKILGEERRGPNRARQKGFENAQGEIIIFIDADTRPPKHWYKRVRQYFEADTSLVGLSGPYRYYDGSLWVKLMIELLFTRCIAPLEQFLIRDFFRRGTLFYGADMAVRRSALEKIGGLDTTLVFFGDDTDLGRRLLQAGEVKFLNSLWVYSSARRLKAEGARVLVNYTINFISQLFFKKVITKDHKDIR